MCVCVCVCVCFIRTMMKKLLKKMPYVFFLNKLVCS